MQLSIQQLEQQIEQFNQRSENQAEKPVIAVAGLLNAGKSYLLNMLSQQIEQEYFKTADQRETTENKTLETDQYIYLDTPGLDATHEDSAAARSGVRDADLILFVHQPQGELDPEEVKFLQELKQDFGEHARNHIAIVITKIEKESDEKIKLIGEKIQKQCREIVNAEFPVFQISSKRYRSGVVQHKDKLVEASHMDVLIEYLQEHSANVIRVRRNKKARELSALLQASERLAHDLKKERSAMLRGFIDAFSEFNGKVDEFIKFYAEQKENYSNI